MSWVRAALVSGVAALAAASFGASGGITVVDGALHHQRDTVAFQHYVETQIGGHSDSATPEDEGALDTAWALAHTDDVLEAGDAACDWLAEQPHAQALDRTGATGVSALATRYLGSLRPVPGPVSEFGLSFIVAGAWSKLCWTDRELRTAPQSDADD